MAWDADRLLPQQVERFGAAGAVVVIAHEVGHAVHRRLGIDAQRARNPARYPTILFESMADCFAGVALAHFVDQPVDGLPIGLDERDQALLALVAFRDPLARRGRRERGTATRSPRVAFQTGYARAPGCAGMSWRTRHSPATVRLADDWPPRTPLTRARGRSRRTPALVKHPGHPGPGWRRRRRTAAS